MSFPMPRRPLRNLPNPKEPSVPKRDAAPIGAPCWIDLFTSDADAARAFYGSLFGWTAEEAGPEFGGYINFAKDEVAVAGCMRNDGQGGTPDLWTIYLATDNVEKTVAKATDHGGQVIVPPMTVGELGIAAVIGDAGQAGIGLWQPGEFPGFGVLAEPGTPNWFELHTRDYDAAVDFYREVFGWDTHTMADTPEFRYTTLGEGDGQLAGIMDAAAFLPEGAPAQWSIYFLVEDADAALTSIVDLGGSIVTPAEDTPYGRLATAADPTGAVFKVQTRP
jgi:predicted enzyme related to lactoylglutathione lyase